MATGKQGFVRAAEPQHSVSMQREKEMRVQAPLTAMYIQAVPGLPSYPQAQPAAMQDTPVIPLSVPMMCASQALPILTLHIAGGAAVQQPRPETPASSPRPKSAGKHVCSHCGRDCLKPSVLEKHLRCHTGERPYPCTTCGISFKTQSNLYKHKRTQAHARLSSESGKGGFSSQESFDSSRETCSSPSLELQSEDSGDMNKSDSVMSTATTTTHSSAQDTSADGKVDSDTKWALRKAAMVGLIVSPAHGQQEVMNSAGQRAQLACEGQNEVASLQTKSPAGDERAPLTPNRTPLQRQVAVSDKMSQGKSQSHDSTDSGFSESSEQHLTSSPGDTLRDPSMESLPESSMEFQEPGRSMESDVATDDTKSKVSVQEKQKLEEHILKLISENSVLVDDKHLVNVRPRKTVLSKQGSIDLPMPYTYKDSFHFEMRSSKHQVSSSPTQDRRGRAMYSSVPTQHSTSLEHAPLTRSSSLPFSVGIQNSDRTVSPYQQDSIPLSRRCSAGNIHPFKSVDQHAPGHRSLVRQAAVDCLSVAEGSSVERGSHSSLSSEGDCNDTSVESGVKRCRRKKPQKFAYNKWYMYGGGTFKKLYTTEKNSVLKSRKSTLNLEQAESQGSQISQHRDSDTPVSVNLTSCTAVSLPPSVNVVSAQTSSQTIPSYVLLQSSSGLLQCSLAKLPEVPNPDLNTETCFVKGMEEKSKGPETQLSSPIPSERKKQKTEDDLPALIQNTDTSIKQQCVVPSRSGQINNQGDAMNQPLQSVCGEAFQTSSITAVEKDNRVNLHRQVSFSDRSCSNQAQLLFKRHSSPLFVGSVSGTSGSPSASSSTSSVSQAKTSFLPKYQLKIPCSTDGASDPCIGNRPSLTQSSPNQILGLSHQSAQQCHPEISLSSAPQSQSTVTIRLSAQDQPGTVTTKAQSTISVAHITQASSNSENKQTNMQIQNQCTAFATQSMSAASISSNLSQPLQTFTALGQNQPVTHHTTHSMDSSLSHSLTPTKPIQMYTSTPTSAVQNNPATSVVISRQPPGLPVDTHAPACQNPMDGIPLEISQTAFQGAQFEGKMLLVNDSQPLAQDTFYVQTADLQIVMQLISDEQLALIEPQIEKQDCLSHPFLNKDPEMSQTDKIPTGVSLETHKQCPGEYGTKLCMAQGIVNKIMLSQSPQITQTLGGATDPNEENSTIRACVLNPQSSDSGSFSNTEDHVSSPLGQQHKVVSSAHEKDSVTKDLKSAGCAIDVRFFEQRPDERPSELPLADKLTAETVNGQQPGHASVHDCVSRNLSVSTFSGVEQSCQDNTGNSRATDTSVTLNKQETTTARKALVLKEKLPLFPDDTSNISSDHQHVLIKKGSLNSLNLKPATSTSLLETKAGTSCVSQALVHPQACISTSSQEELSTVQPCQPESCLLACASPVSARQMISGSALAHTVSQYIPVNQKGNSELKHEEQGNESHSGSQASVQPIQYLSQQQCTSEGAEVIWSEAAQVTGAHFKSVEGGDASEGLEPLSQDSFTGPGVGGALQSPQLQREAGTGRQGCVPQEPETRGGGDEERVGMHDNKCREQEDHAKEDKREGPTGAHEDQTAVKPHPQLSEAVTNVCHNTSSPTQQDTSSVTDCARLALCGASNLSHHFPPPAQRECSDPDNSKQVRDSGGNAEEAPQQISQSESTETGEVPVGCQERVTLSAGSVRDAKHLQPTCAHLLAHPLLVNAIQKEVQKETQIMNNSVSQSNDSQMQCSSSEYINNGSTKSSQPNEHGLALSACNAEAYRTINAIPTCPNRTNSYTLHPLCTPTSTTEPNAPQCHMGGSYLEEEDTSSSSDDEGKLVIELE